MITNLGLVTLNLVPHLFTIKWCGTETSIIAATTLGHSTTAALSRELTLEESKDSTNKSLCLVTVVFTFYIPDLILNPTDKFINEISFTFDCFVNSIYLQFFNCKINCVDHNVFEVSASNVVIKGTSSLEDLFNILID